MGNALTPKTRTREYVDAQPQTSTLVVEGRRLGETEVRWRPLACIAGPDKGLRNVSENNCFLNVVVQSLFHIPSFRNAFASQSAGGHLHPEGWKAEQCLLCSLSALFQDYT